MPKLNRDVLEAPVRSTLLTLAVPAAIGMSGFAVVGMVDAYFLAQTGLLGLSAAGVAIPLLTVFNALAGGVGGGASALVARKVGSQEYREADALIADACFLVTLTSILGILLVFPNIETVVSWIGASQEIAELAVRYIRIALFSQIFLALFVVGNSTLRASGCVRLAAWTLALSASVNGVFDYLLVPGNLGFPALGVEGAALATLLGWIAGCLLVFGILFAKSILTFSTILSLRIRRRMQRIKLLLSYGVPSIISRVILRLKTTLIFSFIVKFGAGATAAYTVVSRVEVLIITMALGLGLVLNMFVGQNLGAGNVLRVKRALRFSFEFSVIFGGLAFLLILIFRQNIALLYVRQSEMVQEISVMLLIMAIGMAGNIYILFMSSIAPALKRPVDGTVLNILHGFGLVLPLGYLGAHLGDEFGLLSGLSIAGLIGLPLGFYWSRRRFSRPLSRS